MSTLNFCIYSLEQLLTFTGLPKYQSCLNELKPPCQKCSHEGRYFSPLRQNKQNVKFSWPKTLGILLEGVQEKSGRGN